MEEELDQSQTEVSQEATGIKILEQQQTDESHDKHDTNESETAAGESVKPIVTPNAVDEAMKDEEVENHLKVKEEQNIENIRHEDGSQPKDDEHAQDLHLDENISARRRQSSLGNKKPEPKRPGKESGRFWICYWEGCTNVYTRRRTVTDHMIKAHKIKKEEFDTDRCKEIIYLDEAKTKWKELDQPRNKRPPKKGVMRPAQLPEQSRSSSSFINKNSTVRLPTNSPVPDNMARIKSTLSGTPTKSINGSRAGTPDNRRELFPGSQQQTDDEYDSAEDDYDEEDGEVYCICRKPDDGTPMVCCDGCDEWYHIKCVGLHKDEVNNLLVKYYCPKCIDEGKGESVFRIECAIPWCHKAALPETKHQFCGPQHHEDWILYHIKRSDPSFQLKSKDAQTLYNGWIIRMKKRHGDTWQPRQVAKVLEDKMGSLSIQESEKPTLGGALKIGELKALIDSVESIEDFKSLGNKAYRTFRPDPNVNIKSRSYLTQDEEGKASLEHRFAVLKELLDLRREVFLKAKATHKPRVYCGYDDRLANNYGAFKKVMDEGDARYNPCEQKNCRRHNDWVKNETRSLGLEAEILREQAKVLGMKYV